ncbi:MAG: hypothetical protein ACRENE_33410, partial [Polyangiaceae bacterium]
MRSIALCVCALGLIACSSENTGQTSEALTSAAALASGDAGDASANAGCTFTQGYWKNHSSAWPVTTLTIGGVVYTEQQLLDLFNTAPGGDASLILGHQLVVALLNVANGAVATATLQQAINDALAWMAANRGTNTALTYGVRAGSTAGQQATAMTQTLDNFNSGLAGTPHCGTGSASSSGGAGSSGSGSGGGAGTSSGSSSGGGTGDAGPPP